MSPAAAERLLGVEVVSKNFACWPLNRFNHNVVVTWLLVLVEGVGDSIWSGTVLASYLYELMGKSNSYAGYVEAAQGLVNLIVALPVGWAADRGSKARIIALGGLLVPVAVGATSFAVVYGTAHITERFLCFWIFVVAMCLWGVVQAVSSGPAQALYAESVVTGERSRYYTLLFGLYLLSSTLGPLVSIIMFVIHGNEWRLADLRNIFLAGMGFELVSSVFFVMYKDAASLEPPASAAPAAADASDAEAGAAEAGEKDAEPAAPPPSAAAPVPHAWMIPYILFASSLAFALASGMTVKFFPLFFKNGCHFSPVAVQSIYLASPVLMAAMSGIGTKLASSFGRAQTMVALKVVGVSLLATMATLADRWYPNVTTETHASDSTLKAALLVAIYLMRTGLMNCTYPLEESILMDFVPPSTRARWKSLDSVGVFGWCGSAALGGYLADLKGYSFTFFITAAIQGVATLMQATLICIVPRAESPAAAAPNTEPLQASLEPGGTTTATGSLVSEPSGSIQ